jgi:hypothetical protein
VKNDRTRINFEFEEFVESEMTESHRLDWIAPSGPMAHDFDAARVEIVV